MNETQEKIKEMDNYIDNFFQERDRAIYDRLIPTNAEKKIHEEIIGSLASPLAFFTIYKNKKLFNSQNSKYMSDENFHEKVDFAKNLINSNEKQYLQFVLAKMVAEEDLKPEDVSKFFSNEDVHNLEKFAKREDVAKYTFKESTLNKVNFQKALDNILPCIQKDKEERQKREEEERIRKEEEEKRRKEEEERIKKEEEERRKREEEEKKAQEEADRIRQKEEEKKARKKKEREDMEKMSTTGRMKYYSDKNIKIKRHYSKNSLFDQKQKVHNNMIATKSIGKCCNKGNER